MQECFCSERLQLTPHKINVAYLITFQGLILSQNIIETLFPTLTVFLLSKWKLYKTVTSVQAYCTCAFIHAALSALR